MRNMEEAFEETDDGNFALDLIHKGANPDKILRDIIANTLKFGKFNPDASLTDEL